MGTPNDFDKRIERAVRYVRDNLDERCDRCAERAGQRSEHNGGRQPKDVGAIVVTWHRAGHVEVDGAEEVVVALRPGTVASPEGLADVALAIASD